MGEGRRRLFLLLLQLSASSDTIFYESFDEPFEGRWIVSEKEEYNGAWKHSKSDGHDDYGLLVSEKARKYAIVKELDQPAILKDKTIVLQYELRLQNGLECGGAYLKFLRPQEAGWIPKEYNSESPYSIMFGPDKCGATNKVHFILKHKNPKTGEYVEHHLKTPTSVPSDKLTHVYTAILKPDNELRILIDGEEKKKANFLSADDFEPALVPPNTIPDPDEQKPEDWDERAKIPDPDAKKPDDWDEDAPMEIEDKDAVKPEGWLDDEPEEIDDPDATKPEDWDDEEDGEWEAPQIDNPRCEVSPGCGEWKKPTKMNPAYKGKWYAPLIDNPNYKGIWKPQEIPNPSFYELATPNFKPIAAVGIEIWTMQDGIVFDNILIASDERVAESYRLTSWKPKFDVEKEKQKAEDAASGISDGLSGLQKKIFDVLYSVSELPLLSSYKSKLVDLIETAEKQPNLTIGAIISILVVIFTILLRVDNLAAQTSNPVAEETSKNQGGSDKEEEGNATTAIRLVDYELPYETHNLYDVHLGDVCIHTLVTHTPHMVDQWIADVQNLNRPNLHQLIVDLDAEWRPNFQPNQGDNPVAVLQLCVARRCLIFQILHAPFLPPSLASFLLNTSYKFVGVGIQRDVERLVEYYSLNVVNQVDLRVLAAGRRDRPDYRNAGIIILARDLLGKKIEKPKWVTMSRWDTEWLSHAQVQYACLDAFLSYEIGKVLNASAPTEKEDVAAPRRRSRREL